MQSEQPTVKRHEQGNQEVDSHMAAGNGQKQEAAPPSQGAPAAAAEKGIKQLTLHALAPVVAVVDSMQAQTVSMLTASGTPAVMATAAASAIPRLLDLHDDSSVSQQQKTVVAVADSTEEEAEKAQAEQALSGQSQGAEQVDAAAASHHSLPGHRPQDSAAEAEQQQLAGVTNGAATAEATQAADQLPLSYPATLVATLPCTMPAWLGHPQRTAASTVIPTQVVSQVYQAGLGPAAQAATAKMLDQSPVADAALSGRMSMVPANMAQQSAAAQAAAPAGRETLQCRAVSRLSQPGVAVCKGVAGMPDEAMGKSQHALGASPGAQQGHAGLSNQALEGTAAAADVALPPRSPDAPKQARAAAKWPSSVPLERGKRPAEGSPAVSDADKAAHKRARSDSPAGVRDKEQGVERWRPSDADVQVSPHASMLYGTMGQLVYPGPSGKQLALLTDCRASVAVQSGHNCWFWPSRHPFRP